MPTSLSPTSFATVSDRGSAPSAIPRCLWIRETYRFRSCALTFNQLGDYARAMQFLQLDAGTEWSSDNMKREYIRDGQLAKAREIAHNFPDVPWARLTIALHGQPGVRDRSQRRTEARLRLWPILTRGQLYGCSRYSLLWAERVSDEYAQELRRPSLLRLLRPAERFLMGEAERYARFAELVSAAKKCRMILWQSGIGKANGV